MEFPLRDDSSGVDAHGTPDPSPRADGLITLFQGTELDTPNEGPLVGFLSTDLPGPSGAVQQHHHHQVPTLQLHSPTSPHHHHHHHQNTVALSSSMNSNFSASSLSPLLRGFNDDQPMLDASDTVSSMNASTSDAFIASSTVRPPSRKFQFSVALPSDLGDGLRQYFISQRWSSHSTGSSSSWSPNTSDNSVAVSLGMSPSTTALNLQPQQPSSSSWSGIPTHVAMICKATFQTCRGAASVLVGSPNHLTSPPALALTRHVGRGRLTECSPCEVQVNMSRGTVLLVPAVGSNNSQESIAYSSPSDGIFPMRIPIKAIIDWQRVPNASTSVMKSSTSSHPIIVPVPPSAMCEGSFQRPAAQVSSSTATISHTVHKGTAERSASSGSTAGVNNMGSSIQILVVTDSMSALLDALEKPPPPPLVSRRSFDQPAPSVQAPSTVPGIESEPPPATFQLTLDNGEQTTQILSFRPDRSSFDTMVEGPDAMREMLMQRASAVRDLHCSVAEGLVAQPTSMSTPLTPAASASPLLVRQRSHANVAPTSGKALVTLTFASQTDEMKFLEELLRATIAGRATMTTSISLRRPVKRFTIVHFNDVYNLAPGGALNGDVRSSSLAKSLRNSSSVAGASSSLSCEDGNAASILKRFSSAGSPILAGGGNAGEVIVGGASRFLTLLDLIREKEGNPLVLFSGDFMGPSLMSVEMKGRQMIDFFNLCGVHYGCFGNHEFDFGMKALSDAIHGFTHGQTLFAGSNTKWIMSNVISGVDGKPVCGAKSFDLFIWNGVHVGIIALSEDWIGGCSKIGPTELVYQDMFTRGENLARALKASGAEFVIALTHARVAIDKLVALRCPSVDLVLGGHDHFYRCAPNQRLVKSGEEFRYLSEICVTISSSPSRAAAASAGQPDDEICHSVDVHCHPVVASIEPSQTAEKLIRRYQAKLDDRMGSVIATTDAVLDPRESLVRYGEGLLTGFVCDVIVDELRRIPRSQACDFAVLGGAAFSGKAIIPEGPITLGDIFQLFPNDTKVLCCSMSGSSVCRLLAAMAKECPEEAVSFPHCSRDLSFTINTLRRPPAIEDVLIRGIPIDELRTYVVGLEEYAACGHGKYNFLTKSIDYKVILGEEQSLQLVLVVLDYFRNERKVVQAQQLPVVHVDAPSKSGALFTQPSGVSGGARRPRQGSSLNTSAASDPPSLQNSLLQTGHSARSDASSASPVSNSGFQPMQPQHIVPLLKANQVWDTMEKSLLARLCTLFTNAGISDVSASAVTGGSFGPAVVLSRLEHSIRKVVGCDIARIFLYDSVANSIVSVRKDGQDYSMAVDATSVVGFAIHRFCAVNIKSASEPFFQASPEFRVSSSKIHSMLCVPLLDMSRGIGAMPSSATKIMGVLQLVNKRPSPAAPQPIHSNCSSRQSEQSVSPVIKRKSSCASPRPPGLHQQSDSAASSPRSVPAQNVSAFNIDEAVVDEYGGFDFPAVPTPTTKIAGDVVGVSDIPQQQIALQDDDDDASVGAPPAPIPIPFDRQDEATAIMITRLTAIHINFAFILDRMQRSEQATQLLMTMALELSTADKNDNQSDMMLKGSAVSRVNSLAARKRAYF